MKSTCLFIVLFFIANSLFSQENKEIDSLKIVLKTVNSDSLKVEILQKISKKYAPISFDSAYYYGKKSLLRSKEIDNKELEFEAYANIGLAFDYQSKIDSTLYWYNKALVLAKEINNIPKLIKVYNHFGVAYFFNTKYDKSIQNYYKSLELSKQIQDSVGIARSYNNIGLIHEKLNNYEEAIRYSLQSLAIKENFKSKAGLIYPLTNLSNVSILKGDFKNGKKYMLRMLTITKELKDTTMMAVSYSNLAKIHAQKNKIKQSDYYLQKAIDLIGKVADRFEYSQLLYDLAGTYHKKGAFKEAEKAYMEAIAISEKLKKRELLEKAYKELSDLYRDEKQYSKSLAYYDKFTKIKDSFFTIDKLNAVSEIQTKYQTQHKEQQINMLKSNIKQQNRFWFWVSVLLILIALLSIFFFYFYKKRSDELAKKNTLINIALAEKELLFKEIHHRVKNNLQLVSSILSLQGRYLTNPKAIDAIKDSQNRINSISLIHQKLYSEASIMGIKMKDYIDDLTYSIIDSLQIDSDNIYYTSSIDNLLLEVDVVTPMGLILNELIINSLKHNRNQEALNLQIALHKKEAVLYLSVTDNGKGIPPDFDYKKSNSYGMRMISSLAKKLKANITFENKNGLSVHLNIHKFKEIEN